jgi:serine/threonine protein kinase
MDAAICCYHCIVREPDHTIPTHVPSLSAERVPLAVGATVGEYTVRRLIAFGGMGAIYDVVDHAGARFALKCLTLDVANDPECVRRFLAEATATARIQSPHVVRVVDVGGGQNGEPPYFVMEFLEGQDLDDLLGRQGPLETTQAVKAVLEACAGLAVAHQQGIIHRDIKTSNLFLTHEGVKVVDFGIAKSIETVDGKLTQTS